MSLSTAMPQFAPMPARGPGVTTTGSSVKAVTFGSTDDVKMLVDGRKWGGDLGTGASLTYSFLVGGISQYLTDYDANDTPFATTVYELSSVQQSAVARSLDRWAAVANVTFSQVTDTADTAGVLRFGGSSAADPTAYAYLPYGNARAGDVWFGTGSNTYGEGSYGLYQVLHEIGHALGLKHPHEGNRLGGNVYDATAHDHLQWTIMSYKDHESDGVGNSNGMIHNYYATTPMIADIAAIQYLYGANTSHRTGNDTYSWTRGARVFETIWDAGGRDTIDWSNQTTAATINLQAGTYSSLGPNITWTTSGGATGRSNARLGIALGVTIENARGGSAADTLHGNAVGNTLWGNGGNDRLNGNAGADTLWGGAANDTLYGGSGNDLLGGGATYDEAGDDLIDGEYGNDVINAGSGNDTVSGGYGFDTMDGGTGTDTLSYAFYTNSNGMYVTLGQGWAYFGPGQYEYLSHFENVVGGGGNDWLVGDYGDNVVSGGLGNDILDGSFGFDTLDGGGGNDTADFSFYTDSTGMTVNLSTGLVSFRSQHAPNGETETLSSIENVVGGGGNDSIFGHGGANSLKGYGGKDVLRGWGGDDTLCGGAGADTMTGDAGRDRFDCTTLTDSAGASIDTITDFNASFDKFDVAAANIRAGFLSTRQVISSASSVTNLYSKIGSVGANQMRLIEVRGGNAQTGLYLFINNGTAGVSSSTDSLVRLQSLTGNLSLACFA